MFGDDNHALGTGPATSWLATAIADGASGNAVFGNDNNANGTGSGNIVVGDRNNADGDGSATRCSATTTTPKARCPAIS